MYRITRINILKITPNDPNTICPNLISENVKFTYDNMVV